MFCIGELYQLNSMLEMRNDFCNFEVINNGYDDGDNKAEAIRVY